MRRYCRANQIDRLATLTYREEPASWAQVVKDVRRFRERFGKRFGRRALVSVNELGTKNGRLHVHIGVNFFVPKPVLARLWGKGFVDIRRFGQRGQRWKARDLAAYLAKYVAKELEEVTEEGPKQRADREHRYHLSQGFSPKAVRFRFYRVGNAEKALRALHGDPDMECSFGDWTEDFIFGRWYSFPDAMCHPPPKP